MPPKPRPFSARFLQFSGTAGFRPISAYSGAMLVTFTSDQGIGRRGFDASYHAFNCTNSCSGIVLCSLGARCLVPRCCC